MILYEFFFFFGHYFNFLWYVNYTVYTNLIVCRRNIKVEKYYVDYDTKNTLR